MVYVKAIENIHRELTTYVTENNIQALVLGISGGIDSALCAALARPVCDDLRIPLIGRSLPILSNKTEEKERAKAVGKAFCTEFEEEDLTQPFADLAISMDLVGSWRKGMNTIQIGKKQSTNDKIRVGNTKARLRMIHLYNIASETKGMVLSTDNYTELLLGFWTLHGDVGDYGMIQNLWKMEVYGMAQHIADATDNEDKRSALSACVQATPTDGLGITNSDLDQLGVKTYEEADTILKIWLRDPEAKPKGTDFEDIRRTYSDHPIVLRYERTHFKRINPYNIPRDVLKKEGA